MDDDYIFANDEGDEEVTVSANQWVVLIVDDEPEIHSITRLALSDFSFEGQKLQFLSAKSGAEAMALLKQRSDIAVVLLDVVMETDHAGLEVARYIRDELGNLHTRIILRTGQPGQAPERDVIVNYDINDYKSKTELTSQKLFTTVISSLRAYRDIVRLEEQRIGLEKIIRSSADLFTMHSLESFVEGLIQQLSSLIGCSKDAAYLTSAVAAPTSRPGSTEDFVVFAGRGEYQDKEGLPLTEALSANELQTCEQALEQHDIIYSHNHLAAYCRSKNKRGSLLYLSGLPQNLSQIHKDLIALFAENVQRAFDNVIFTKDLEDTHVAILKRLAPYMEGEPGRKRHIDRMNQVATILAKAVNMPEDDIAMLRLALPLHDVGKMQLPARILQKQGPLDDIERQQVIAHAKAGHDMLAGSELPVLKLAAIVALEHHEHWDGSGYPRGLEGEQIHLCSRITALVDVLDTLMSQTAYKEAWSLDACLQEIKALRGGQFDPVLVDILLDKHGQLAGIYP